MKHWLPTALYYIYIIYNSYIDYDFYPKQTTKTPTLETFPLLLFPLLNGIIAAWTVRMNGLFSVVAMFFSGSVSFLNATRKDWEKTISWFDKLFKCYRCNKDSIFLLI